MSGKYASWKRFNEHGVLEAVTEAAPASAKKLHAVVPGFQLQLTRVAKPKAPAPASAIVQAKHEAQQGSNGALPFRSFPSLASARATSARARAPDAPRREASTG